MLTLLPQFSDRLECLFLDKNEDRNLVGRKVCLHQVHGNRTIISREPMENSEEADGVITDQKGLHLMVRAADCQNFAIFDPEKNIGGVLHAGWKGLVAGAIPEFFRTLSAEFGSDISQIFVAAGPSLCTACAEFSDPKSELPESFKTYTSGRCVDLQKYAENQMLSAGVLPQNFFRHPDCTRCHPELYLTYRGGDKSEVQAGVSNVLVLTLRR